ncbi:MAG: FtsW/RodA/SpoVE family cell cycle protein [bacterium]
MSSKSIAKKSGGVDKIFLFLTIILVIVGFFIFYSASLGLLAGGTVKFMSVTFNQIVFGILGGGIAATITAFIPYTFWRKWGFLFFGGSVVLMLLVFVPHVGIFHGGARRWIGFGGASMQPAEFYKIGFVLYTAAWFASVKQKASTLKFGTIPLIILIALSAGLILMQPDTETFLVVAASAVAIYLVSGGQWKHLFLIAGVGAIGLAVLVSQRPYLQQRISTFMDPSKDATGSGYQIQQSLIAIGSGGLTGRGFGQSTQKFAFLPEPIGDSIFAVASEEFGFVGSVAIILLYIMFAFQALRIATRVPDPFGAYVIVGIIVLIVLQSFMNIAAMLAIVPLSGTPLLFISHGGTALFFTMASAGIILNISRYQKR